MTTYIPPLRQASPHLPFGDKQDAPFYGKDILSVKQFNHESLEYIFGVAHEMQEMVRRVGSFDLLKGKILASLFYEPSTRTSSSFTAAMERLGGSVIPINEVRYSSVSKGESLPDTVRTLESLRGCDRAAPPGDRRGRAGCAIRPQAGHQRGRWRRRAPHPGAARSAHHPRGAGPGGRPDRDDAGRSEIWPHRAFARPAADAVRHPPELRLAGHPAHARRNRRRDRSHRHAAG